MLTKKQKQTFQQHIWQWYRKHARDDLPWRQDITPYRILISEVMLQQTQVDRVVPYFLRWIKKLPTIFDLAAAPKEQVLQLWSGLGYNRRALYLHAAAKLLVQDFQGRLPQELTALQKLPGIGPYTAAAIAAFAFEKPVVVLETNIRAVYLHHFFPEADAKTVPDSLLEPLVRATIETGNVRHWYYALMDYGSWLKRQYQNPTRKSRHWQRQSAFEGSFRQVRGAVLKAVLVEQLPPDPHQLANSLPFSRDQITKAVAVLREEGFF